MLFAEPMLTVVLGHWSKFFLEFDGLYLSPITCISMSRSLTHMSPATEPVKSPIAAVERARRTQ
ncbi:hypothetical protein EJB05_25138, partial [Eragrostis curvula]